MNYAEVAIGAPIDIVDTIDRPSTVFASNFADVYAPHSACPLFRLFGYSNPSLPGVSLHPFLTSSLSSSLHVPPFHPPASLFSPSRVKRKSLLLRPAEVSRKRLFWVLVLSILVTRANHRSLPAPGPGPGLPGSSLFPRDPASTGRPGRLA